MGIKDVQVRHALGLSFLKNTLCTFIQEVQWPEKQQSFNFRTNLQQAFGGKFTFTDDSLLFQLTQSELYDNTAVLELIK